VFGIPCAGEGNAVAINLVLRSVLEEMCSAEQLWAVHSGVSSTYSTVTIRNSSMGG
jgi:hypothetical protein